VNRKLYFVSEHFQKDLPVDEGFEITSEQNAEEKLQELINQIPERRREIFRLSRFEGLSYKQIAEKLHISENTVDSQIRNALAFLRKEFRKIIAIFIIFFSH
jgi:RNA polymerase sigma-70 factor (ECF subfamily)